MNLKIGQLVFLMIGTGLAVIYILILLSASKKYKIYLENLDDKKHFFKPLYAVGFWVLDAIHYQFTSRLDKLRYRQCKVIYGEKYSTYYFRLNYAAKIGVGLYVIPFVFLAYGAFQKPVVLLAGFLGVFIAYWNYDMKITDIAKIRDREIESDFPDVISKVTLLVNAGMILKDAWEKVAYTGKSTVYLEMQNALAAMNNGVSEIDAMLDFGNRCMNERVKKFASTLVQNMTKGNAELVDFLRTETAILWEEKKHGARRQGEAASSKLMLPIGVMFVGILILVIVPVFTNLSF